MFDNEFSMNMNSPVGESLMLAGIALTIALLWIVYRRTRFGAKLLSRYLWVGTAANFVIIPLTIYGVGRLTTRVFETVEQFNFARISETTTQLLLILTVAIGRSNCRDLVWREPRRRRQQ